MKVLLSTLTLSAVVLFAGSASLVAGPPHCPPGLAKKAVPCVPPGLVGKSVRVGHPLPDGIRYVVLRESDWRRYGLDRPRRGSSYVLVDSEILRVADATLKVIEAVRAVQALGN
jgi:hypothetical protein